MEVASISPLRVGSVLWRPRPDRWTVTVVCKATYALEPGESGLAPDQEAVRGRDTHWDDDPRRSLYAPSDLAPFKPRADVVLVGNAYAPRSELVRSLVARLIVGEMEKAVEIHAPRVLGREGDLREGQRWNKMPLRYEYAAGGLDTWNPVGIAKAAPLDTYGQRVLPHLQPPGLRVNQWSDVFVPTGFGPIPTSWRLRRDKLGRRGEGWSDEGWTQIALDDDFDGEFFQVAPPDQQIETLHEDERIVLEYLSSDHPSLTTKLVGLRPHAVVELPGSPSRDLVMTADTLWIDTDRGLCTLTWRGAVAVDGPDQPGRVVVGLEDGAPRPQTLAYGRQDPTPFPEPKQDSAEPAPTPRTMDPRRTTLQMAAPDLPPPDTADPEPVEATDTPRTPPRTQPPRATQQMVVEVPAKAPAWLEKPRAPTETTQVSHRIPVPPLVPRERAFELVWASRKLAARLREVDAWASVAGPGAPPGTEAATVLSRGTPTQGNLEAMLFEAVGPSGMLAPRLLLLEGELVLQEGASDHASERRILFGRGWIRARFKPSFATNEPVPAYLPATLSTRLPLFRSFPARVIAELVPCQEEADESAVALKVGALARAIVRRA
jgi:hypothetical protein